MLLFQALDLTRVSALRLADQIEPAGAKPLMRLPRTGSEDNTAWMWLAFGMALLLFGGLVGFGPVMGGKSPALVLRTHAANSALLRGLLSAPTRSARAPEPRKPARPSATSDDLLAALLEVDARQDNAKR